MSRLTLPLALAALTVASCRSPDPSSARARLAPAPRRPAGILATIELPSPRWFVNELSRHQISVQSTINALSGWFGVESRVLPALDPSRGSVGLWMSSGLVLSLPLRGASDAEALFADRAPFREEPALGAWITARDAGRAPPCLLRAAEAGVRLLCGPDEETLRAVAPWLSTQRLDGAESVRVRVEPEGVSAIASRVRSGLHETAEWLDAEAARARRERGAPALGDPEPLVAWLRANSNEAVAWIAAMSGLSLELRGHPDGAQLELGADWRGRESGDAGVAPLRLTLPLRGFGLAWRVEQGLAAQLAATASALLIEVRGARTPDRSAVERSLSEWSRLVGETGSIAISFEGERPSAVGVISMRDHGAAARVAREFGATRWGLPGGSSPRASARGGAIELSAGELRSVEVSVAPGAWFAGVFRAGDDPTQALTLVARQEAGRGALRVTVGAQLLRAAVGGGGRARDH